MAHADLHVHTTRSDGTLSFEAIPEAAERAGVSVVGLTDHDRLQPLEGPVVERSGITLVHGIELRVETADGDRVDLLGYGVEATPALEAMIDRIQTDRRERASEIIERTEGVLGVELEVPVGVGVGRPHVARAIDEHPDVDCDYAGAFDGLIGSGDPAYVPRDIPSFEEGLAVLEDACAITALAHPLRYSNPERALSLTAELDVLEVHYPYGRKVDLAPVEAAVEAHDLLVTGGSDAHDDRLGLAGLTESEWDRLSQRLPIGDES